MRESERGFVLPYVLATIAILSLIAVLGANTLRDAQANVRRLETHDRLTDALDDAEQVVIDTFSTATLVPDGLYLGPRLMKSDIDLELGIVEKGDAADESQEWSSIGGLRRVDVRDVPVAIEYQDASGLVSLYTASTELVARVVREESKTEGKAEELAVKLSDFMDMDDQRQFSGGERADYRMARMNPPTNSPVRNWEELAAVLDWAEQPFFSNYSLLKYLTFFNGGSTPRMGAMTPALKVMLEDSRRRAREVEDPLTDTVAAISVMPSNRARFMLTAAAPGRAYGLRRVIETERTANAPDFPVSRRLVAEYMVPADELESLDLDGLPALAVSTPGRTDQ